MKKTSLILIENNAGVKELHLEQFKVIPAIRTRIIISGKSYEGIIWETENIADKGLKDFKDKVCRICGLNCDDKEVEKCFKQ